MSARASSPAGPGEVAGRSRASARNATARDRRDGAVDQLHRRRSTCSPMSTGESARPAPTPSMLASVIRPTAVARSPGGEPVGRHLGPRVEQERLGDGDADGAEQDQRVVAAGESPRSDAEDAHQHDAEPDGDAEPAAVDDPGRRQRQRDEGDHEHHRQQRRPAGAETP